MNILEDWKQDIKVLQSEFKKKTKTYSIVENAFFVWIMLITSLAEVIKFSADNSTYTSYTSIITYLIVVSTGVKKYINPEKKKEKFKFGYIEAKTLEDYIESQTLSPDKNLPEFLSDLRDRKTKILEKYM